MLFYCFELIIILSRNLEQIFNYCITGSLNSSKIQFKTCWLQCRWQTEGFSEIQVRNQQWISSLQGENSAKEALSVWLNIWLAIDVNNPLRLGVFSIYHYFGVILHDFRILHKSYNDFPAEFNWLAISEKFLCAFHLYRKI